jgi:hypothetical protein
MRHRILFTWALAALAAAAAAAPSAQAASRSVPVRFLGVNAGGPMRDPGFAVEPEYSLMAGAGVESVRMPIYWPDEQPYRTAREVPTDQRNRFADAGGVPTDFSTSDGQIGAAAAHGLRVMPTVLRAPLWAALRPDKEGSPPRDPHEYASFLTALVRRYGPGGSFWRAHPELPAVPVRSWQVWNEPGQPFYWDAARFARGYVALLRAARAAIKNADPRAQVVLAGLNSGIGYRAWTDLGKIYRAGGRRLFDAAAVHPFSLRTANVVRTVELFRDVMSRYGDARKPVLLTEISWPASAGYTHLGYGFEVDERAQARRLAEALPLLARLRRRLRIGQVYWYTWLSPPLGSSDPFDYSGLRRQSSSGVVDRPALAAYRRVARRLEGCVKSTRATRCR